MANVTELESEAGLPAVLNQQEGAEEGEEENTPPAKITVLVKPDPENLPVPASPPAKRAAVSRTKPRHFSFHTLMKDGNIKVRKILVNKLPRKLEIKRLVINQSSARDAIDLISPVKEKKRAEPQSLHPLLGASFDWRLSRPTMEILEEALKEIRRNTKKGLITYKPKPKTTSLVIPGMDGLTVADVLVPVNKVYDPIIDFCLNGTGSPKEIIGRFHFPGYKIRSSITREEMECLGPGKYLNDTVINFFFRCIAHSHRQYKGSKKKILYLPPDFFQGLMREYNPLWAKERYFDKRVPGNDIFGLDMIIAVYNLNGIHWYLVVAYMQKKTITCYDPLNCCDSTGLLMLYGILRAMYRIKYKEDLEPWSLTYATPKECPNQDNGYDCGVFVCMYGYFLYKDWPFCFEQKHMEQCRARILMTILNICSNENILESMKDVLDDAPEYFPKAPAVRYVEGPHEVIDLLADSDSDNEEGNNNDNDPNSSGNTADPNDAGNGGDEGKKSGGDDKDPNASGKNKDPNAGGNGDNNENKSGEDDKAGSASGNNGDGSAPGNNGDPNAGKKGGGDDDDGNNNNNKGGNDNEQDSSNNNKKKNKKKKKKRLLGEIEWDLAFPTKKKAKPDGYNPPIPRKLASQRNVTDFFASMDYSQAADFDESGVNRGQRYLERLEAENKSLEERLAEAKAKRAQAYQKPERPPKLSEVLVALKDKVNDKYKGDDEVTRGQYEFVKKMYPTPTVKDKTLPKMAQQLSALKWIPKGPGTRNYFQGKQIVI